MVRYANIANDGNQENRRKRRQTSVAKGISHIVECNFSHREAQTNDVQKIGHFNFNTEIDRLLHSHKVTVEALQKKDIWFFHILNLKLD